MNQTGKRTNRTEYTILGCLSLRPMSGYDIKQLIDQSIGHFWSESYGQIYPSLKRLEENGLVTRVAEATHGGRRRREYGITDAGLQALRAWLTEPAQPDVVRYETSLKLFFGGQMHVEDARAHVRRYRATQRRLLEQYGGAAERLKREHAGSPFLPYWQVVLDGGIRYGEMAVAWCDATLEQLDRLDERRYPAGPADPAGSEADLAARGVDV